MQNSPKHTENQVTFVISSNGELLNAGYTNTDAVCQVCSALTESLSSSDAPWAAISSETAVPVLTALSWQSKGATAWLEKQESEWTTWHLQPRPFLTNSLNQSKQNSRGRNATHLRNRKKNPPLALSSLKCFAFMLLDQVNRDKQDFKTLLVRRKALNASATIKPLFAGELLVSRSHLLSHRFCLMLMQQVKV